MLVIKFANEDYNDLDVLYELDKLSDKLHWKRSDFNFKNPIILAIIEQKIVGFLVYQNLDVIEILRISVDFNFKKCGIASALIDKLKIHKKNIILEVRYNNISAINLYKKLGFKQIDTRKNYYSNGDDAKIMQWLYKV